MRRRVEGWENEDGRMNRGKKGVLWDEGEFSTFEFICLYVLF